MSDSFETICGAQDHARRVCKVAYTLNNTQPVACTIIGDQPLFYMDYVPEYEDEEDMSFDAADIGLLETEIEVLKKEIASFDKFSENFAQSPEQCFEDFQVNKGYVTDKAKTGEASAEALIDVMQGSRLAQAYLGFAEEHKIEIKLSGQVEDGFYDRRTGTILINDSVNTTDQILLLARELRRHWQHRQGALIHPLMFHPDNAVLVNRLQSADLAVSMVRIAWELQLSGMKEAWERIENSSMGDLGRAFAHEAFLDFRTINNGQASAAIFESWFLSERPRSEDKRLINQMLADYQGYVFDLEEAEQNITPSLISALGTMPFGKNYLSSHVITIMNDPIFTDVRDRSNANFLWFIKFERTFRETEQELQTDDSQHIADGIRLMASSENRDQNYDNTKEDAEIITLYANAEGEAQSTAEKTGDKPGKKGKRLGSKIVGKPNKNKQSGEVIYLRRWSGE